MELLSACDGDVEEFERLTDMIGKILDSLLPMREMNVKVKFNEELESLREYIVQKMKSRQPDSPPFGESR